MSKKKFGEMSLYGLIISLTLIVILSPLFLYIQTRQNVSLMRENIEISLQDKSKQILNELYDDVKDVNSSDEMFALLSNNNYIRNDMARDILRDVGFKNTTGELYEQKNTKVLSPKIRLIKGDSNSYVLKLSYNLKQSLAVFGNSFYTYSGFYYSECRISRDRNYKSKKANVENSNNEEDYKDFTMIDISKNEKMGDDVSGYLSPDGKKLYIDGVGYMKDFTYNTKPWGCSDPDFGFSDSDKLEEVYFKGAVYNVGKDAFSNCRSLEKVVLNNSVKSVDSRAFSGCSMFHEITIPKSVNLLGTESFYNCPELAKIKTDLTESEWDYLNYKSIKQLGMALPPVANLNGLGNPSVWIYCSNLEEDEHIDYKYAEYLDYCQSIPTTTTTQSSTQEGA